MDIAGWEKRYRAAEGPREKTPTKLVLDTAAGLLPGQALDLACGTGRNALALARLGWQVTAIDGSEAAIGALRERAQTGGLTLETTVADLQDPEFSLPEAGWDLVMLCYYLQRNLIERAKHAVLPGGHLLVVVHTTEGTEEPTESRLRPGELIGYFQDWSVIHSFEGKPNDPEHKRSVAEVVVRRPLYSSRSD